MRKRRFLSAAMVLVGLLATGFVLSGSAEADTAFFPSTMKYGSCALNAQFEDYNDFSKHQGYATFLRLTFGGSGPSGCSFVANVDIDYYKSGNKSGMEPVDYAKMPKNDLILYGGPAGNDGVRLRSGSTITLCKDYYDECKNFTSKLVS